MRRHDRLPSAVDVRDAFKLARDSFIQSYCNLGDISGSTSTIVIKSVFVLIMSFRNQGELIIANIGDTSGFVCCDVRLERVLYCRNQESLLLSQQIIASVMILRRNEFWRLEGELKINDSLGS